MTDFATRDIAPPPFITYGCGKATGFTLIELSVVLVVIGLMVMGILSGQSIIHASKLKAVISEVSTLKTALNLYNLKYDALPGDHRDAYDYFDGSGGNSVCGSNSLYECNGDGDWKIANSGLPSHERGIAMQHLGLAGFIPPHAYSTAYDSSFSDEGNFWLLYTTNNGKSGNAILFIKGVVGSNKGLITPTDAKSIDKKIDDGIGGTGKVHGSSTASNACVYTSTSDKPYYVSKTAPKCTMLFFID